ncbi:MAG: hypothetical protein GY793_07945 [Proteobacteria bacterium]|nr:hypothetical protein [Pseudomonadota bacterium]
MKITKKAAMFGLDARIALAIFGALSVVTGASLYSALKGSKVTALIAELDNVDKAITQYYLDTGMFPTEQAVGSGLLKIEELISSTASGWKGPYITFKDNADLTDGVLLHPIYTNVSIFRNTEGFWDVPSFAFSTCSSTGTDNCFIFTCYTGVPTDITDAIESKLDTVVENSAGNIRTTGGGTICRKGMTYNKRLAP